MVGCRVSSGDGFLCFCVFVKTDFESGQGGA